MHISECVPNGQIEDASLNKTCGDWLRLELCLGLAFRRKQQDGLWASILYFADGVSGWLDVKLMGEKQQPALLPFSAAVGRKPGLNTVVVFLLYHAFSHGC